MEPASHATTTGYQNFLYITGPPCPDYLRRLPLSDAVLISIGLHCGQVLAQLRVILKEGQNLGQRNDADHRHTEIALHFLDRRQLTLPRSCRSSATITAAGCAPAALMICMTSRIAVPAVITSSTMATLPCSGAPTSEPPSP